MTVTMAMTTMGASTPKSNKSETRSNSMIKSESGSMHWLHMDLFRFLLFLINWIWILQTVNVYKNCFKFKLKLCINMDKWFWFWFWLKLLSFALSNRISIIFRFPFLFLTNSVNKKIVPRMRRLLLYFFLSSLCRKLLVSAMQKLRREESFWENWHIE